MRILALPCILLFLIGSAVAQDTNFAAGPQYLLTGSSLLAPSTATPPLPPEPPLPPVDPAIFNIAEAATEVPFSTNPQLEHQADLIPIYYGADNHYGVSTALVEI